MEFISEDIGKITLFAHTIIPCRLKLAGNILRILEYFFGFTHLLYILIRMPFKRIHREVMKLLSVIFFQDFFTNFFLHDDVVENSFQTEGKLGHEGTAYIGDGI